MHIHVYIFTQALSTEEAKSNVRCYLDDYCGDHEPFDYGGIEEYEYEKRKTALVSDIAGELPALLEYAEQYLEQSLKQFDEYRTSGDRGAMGYQASIIHDIAGEHFCSDMPYFNMETEDWTVPTEKSGVNGDWYAVPVDLHC